MYIIRVNYATETLDLLKAQRLSFWRYDIDSDRNAHEPCRRPNDNTKTVANSRYEIKYLNYQVFNYDLSIKMLPVGEILTAKIKKTTTNNTSHTEYYDNNSINSPVIDTLPIAQRLRIFLCSTIRA